MKITIWVMVFGILWIPILFWILKGQEAFIAGVFAGFIATFGGLLCMLGVYYNE